MILLYPMISNLHNKKVSSKIITNYNSRLEQITDNEYDLSWQNARKYNSDSKKTSRFLNNGESEDETYLARSEERRVGKEWTAW